MSPRQLDEWPKEKEHEFRIEGVFIYCKCQTVSIGTTKFQTAEEVQEEHLKIKGVLT